MTRRIKFRDVSGIFELVYDVIGDPIINGYFRERLGKNIYALGINIISPFKSNNDTKLACEIHPEKVLFIMSLSINPSKRNKGFGRLIINELYKIAQLSGAKQIQLTHTGSFVKAFERLGFTGMEESVGVLNLDVDSFIGYDIKYPKK